MRVPRFAFIGLVSLTLVLAALLVFDSGHEDSPALEVGDPSAAKGSLLVSFYGDRPTTAAPMRHSSEFTNGANGYRMEDNDLRGFLDGNFKWAWNQASQVHLRVGRRQKGAKYGEFELFRNIHRWDPIALPPLAEVHDARLSIAVEEAPETSLRLLLYEVKKDWDPGNGGTAEDNVSPPKTGEVWWNDVGYEQRPWGLPGASFASDHHTDADTGAMPLAEALYSPGDQEIEFQSPDLAGYISGRIHSHEPLLFLVKLSDYQEDIPGALISLYSANHGDSHNPGRRPHLRLTWSSPAEIDSFQRRIFLEYGRQHVLPRLHAREVRAVAASFLEEPGYIAPTIEVRGGASAGSSSWLRQPEVLEVTWDWLEFRLLAAKNPLFLGEPFTADIRDTWVTTGPPRDQEVMWEFSSPTGRIARRLAEYAGENRWHIEFSPDEIGPWRYRWEQNFTDVPRWSMPGEFDVLGRDSVHIQEQLEGLAREISNNSLEDDPLLRRSLMIRFSRLERAAMRIQTPATYSSSSGRDLRRQLNLVRRAFGEPVVGPPPMISGSLPWNGGKPRSLE